MRNSDIKHTLAETRLSLLTVDGKLEIKYPLGKASYWIRAESKQDLSSSTTIRNSFSIATPVVSPLIYKHQLNLQKNLTKTIISLEERVNLLNTECTVYNAVLYNR